MVWCGGGALLGRTNFVQKAGRGGGGMKRVVWVEWRSLQLACRLGRMHPPHSSSSQEGMDGWGFLVPSTASRGLWRRLGVITDGAGSAGMDWSFNCTEGLLHAVGSASDMLWYAYNR